MGKNKSHPYLAAGLMDVLAIFEIKDISFVTSSEYSTPMFLLTDHNTQNHKARININ